MLSFEWSHMKGSSLDLLLRVRLLLGATLVIVISDSATYYTRVLKPSQKRWFRESRTLFEGS